MLRLRLRLNHLLWPFSDDGMGLAVEGENRVSGLPSSSAGAVSALSEAVRLCREANAVEVGGWDLDRCRLFRTNREGDVSAKLKRNGGRMKDRLKRA